MYVMKPPQGNILTSVVGSICVSSSKSLFSPCKMISPDGGEANGKDQTQRNFFYIKTY